jgi:hypothetical protein
MKAGVFKYVLLVCISLISTMSFAERFSYIYIQGDKETPFYVKLDDEMLTRYGKNYCIVSELSPGPAKIQILFQQNEFAPQNFVIQVPENGFRGFLLTHKNGQFSLYDIHQQFYLPAGNKADEDRLPSMTSRIKEVSAPAPPPVSKPATQTVTPKKTVAEKPVKTPPVVLKKEKPVPTPPPAEVSTPAVPRPASTPRTAAKSTPTPDVPATAKKEPKFIDDIKLQNGRTQSPDNTITKNEAAKPRAHIINSDCPRPMTAMDFSSIYNNAMERAGADRLKYMLIVMDNCYSTNQAREFAGLLDSDAEKYTLLRRMYARISDQENFPDLEKLFTDAEWKNYFKSLIK